MKKNKGKLASSLFKYFFLTLFITYVALYLSSATGYYNYEQHKKTVLTEEKIREFEKDVREGKNLDIENYLESTNKNYQNNTSKLGYEISKKIETGAKIGIEKMFSFLSKIFDE